jgi:hypothetical protein
MSNRRTVAMEVNDDAGSLTPRGARWFFASMLAPTGPAAIDRSHALRGNAARDAPRSADDA